MTYEASKFKEDYLGARQALREFGTSGIRMFRVPEIQADQIPDQSAEPAEPEEQAFSFAGLILPINRQEPGQEENLEATFGKERALLCLEEITDPPAGYELIKPKDFFTINANSFQVVSIQKINPDQNFPVIFDLIVTG